MMSRWSIAFLLVVLQCCATLVSGQWTPTTAERLLEKLRANRARYEGLGDYNLSYRMLSYKDQRDQAAYDAASARIWKVGGNIRAEQFGYLTLQDERIQLTIDSTERTVLIAAPSDGLGLEGATFSESVLSQARAIGMRSNGHEETYRIMFNERAIYEAIEVTFEGSNWMRLVVVYWNKPLEGALAQAPDYLRPKLETRLGIPEKVTRSEARPMDPWAFIQERDGNVVLAPQLKGYELIDTRPR